MDGPTTTPKSDATRGKGRGRPKGKGKTTRKAVTQVEECEEGAGRHKTVRVGCRARSVEVNVEQELSLQESSTTVKGRGRSRNRGGGRAQAFVTQDTFANEMGKLQETLQALLAHETKEALASKERSEEKSTSEMSEPPVTMVGSHSQSTPIIAATALTEKGCSYKSFAACKPPIFKEECDPIVVIKWIGEMELTFDTSKCAEEDKVVFALSMLRDNVVFWWEAETGGRGSKAAKGMVWETFVAKVKRQFCPLVVVKKLEEVFLTWNKGR
ncbi:hypothetical protein L6452_40632 [Arctium lappa]|uniref:Uncharacterized protein n=1 Tax=Arctium lappa TaxID=4217 RepID=A0ACB8XMF8_ARCLA|nr:hypothetical protein L6452_40632 [Arctium lappa]